MATDYVIAKQVSKHFGHQQVLTVALLMIR